MDIGKTYLVYQSGNTRLLRSAHFIKILTYRGYDINAGHMTLKGESHYTKTWGITSDFKIINFEAGYMHRDGILIDWGMEEYFELTEEEYEKHVLIYGI